MSVKKRILPTFVSLCALCVTGMFLVARPAHADNRVGKIMSDVLLSIVIIESEQIEYTSPYHQDHNANILFPFFLFKKNSIKNDVQGNGIKHKRIFGSGVLLQQSNEKYYIITNNHVTENSTNIIVTTHDGVLHNATLEGADESRDIAVISIPNTQKSYPAISLGTTDDITVGMPVYVVGSPFGFTFTISKGIVSAVNRTDSAMDNIFVQTDAAMHPGNSGGALIDEQGALVGISTWIYSIESSANIGINFASTIDIALDISRSIIQGKTPSYGWIGIVYDTFTAIELMSIGIPYRFGSIVTNIVKDSPAHRGGLKIGDMLISVQNQSVHAFNSTINNTKALISTIGSNKDIDVVVIRDKIEKTLQLRTEERPSLEALHEVTMNLWPGMTVTPLPPYKKELMGLPHNNTVLTVKTVYPDTPADYSGIEADHIITKINNSAITGYSHYLEIVNNSINTKEPIALELFENGYYIDSVLQWQDSPE